MKFIGIDIGTTSICGILTDSETGEILKSLTLDNNSFIKSDNEWEKIQNCDIIIATAKKILDTLICDSVAGIGISNQMHGITYIDGNANALSPLYIWQDARGNLTYKDSTYAYAFGCPSGYGLTTDFYNEINGLIPENTYKLCTIGDLLALKLTGETEPLMHITNAASLGKFDIVNNRFTCNNPRLPNVTKNFDIVGLYKDIPVTTAIGDNQASFFGSSRYDGVLINVGTGSQISFTTDKPEAVKDTELRPLDGSTYLLVGAALCGGRAFSLYEKFIRRINYLITGKTEIMYPVIDKMLEGKTSSSLTADTRFCGTRQNPYIKGSITGIDESDFTPEDFAYSILEGIINELYMMFQNANKKCTFLTASGNGIRKNPTLCKIAERKFGAELHIPKHSEEASFGAALVSMCSAGIFASVTEAQKLIKY